MIFYSDKGVTKQVTGSALVWGVTGKVDTLHLTGTAGAFQGFDGNTWRTVITSTVDGFNPFTAGYKSYRLLNVNGQALLLSTALDLSDDHTMVGANVQERNVSFLHRKLDGSLDTIVATNYAPRYTLECSWVNTSRDVVRRLQTLLVGNLDELYLLELESGFSFTPNNPNSFDGDLTFNDTYVTPRG